MIVAAISDLAFPIVANGHRAVACCLQLQRIPLHRVVSSVEDVDFFTLVDLALHRKW